MKNFLSTALVAAPLVLLAPNNAAEAVGSLAGMLTPSAVAQPVVMPLGTIVQQATENVSTAAAAQNPEPTMAWLMAFGFLALVVLRRVRGE
ncbi:MAG TPA: hypothetical protein VM073_07970 [Usitatibacter sp.]|nr:hypothetical protein [Usitatibacter sp.]